MCAASPDEKVQPTVRNLRKRIAKDEPALSPPPKRARNNGIVACMKMCKLMPASKEELVEGMVVIAKMRSYAAWPAMIQNFRKTCINVRFFGDDTTGNVPYDSIGLFHANTMIIKQNLTKKIAGYYKAVSMAEGTLKVPSSLSILNSI